MKQLRKIISWIGILTLGLIIFAAWAFFIRGSDNLQQARQPAILCAEGEVEKVQGPRVKVFYQQSSPCTQADQKVAEETRAEAEEAIERIESEGFPSFRNRVSIDYGDRPIWGAWVNPGTPASIRVPAKEEDRKFYLYSALVSVALQEGAPGIEEVRPLAEGFALYFLRNPIVQAGKRSRLFYDQLLKDRRELELKIRSCRDRQCSLSELL